MWGLTPIPKKWTIFLGGLFVLGLIAVVVGLVLVVVWSGPQSVEHWKQADSYERDTVIVLLIFMSWMTRSKTECKCSGKCDKS